MTAEQKDRIREQADELGLSMSAFMLMTTLKAVRQEEQN